MERGAERDVERVATRLSAIGWGLFFLWLGVVFLGGLPVGLGLGGVAVITLGVQGARKGVGLRIEGFWLLVGLGFLLAAIWEFTAPGIPLVPVLLVLAGIALMMFALGKRS